MTTAALNVITSGKFLHQHLAARALFHAFLLSALAKVAVGVDPSIVGLARLVEVVADSAFGADYGKTSGTSVRLLSVRARVVSGAVGPWTFGIALGSAIEVIFDGVGENLLELVLV